MRLPDIFSGSVTKDGVHGDLLKKKETKAIEPDTFGLRPDELELPEAKADPHGMSFTDEELAALTVTDDEAAKALAFGLATPEKRRLIGDKE